MRYASGNAFRTALEQRLKSESTRTGNPLPRLRKLVAFDRLLVRLVQVAPNRWRLKCALALDYRLGAGYRTTRDMDLSRQDSDVDATRDFLAAQSLALDDAFSFTLDNTSGRDNALEGIAARYRLTSHLAGRRFETIAVDVSFSDPFLEPAELLQSPELLGFADIAPVTVPAIPLEQHMAEKLHAYTRTYGDQRRSSRAKDLIDLVLVQDALPLSAGRLRLALTQTFANRATHPLPRKTPTAPTDWGDSFATIASEVGLNPDSAAGYRAVATLLDPILAGDVDDERVWNPVSKRWE